ncbi:flagellar motor switch protein FliG [Monaibacterium marinum]|uniref:Flagellar motor switch protein FliG n=1 Tax=Pontivivens marinum TaxID=1690039 RepID=A0A2C9CTA4_9RHOB|nr:FliG C-terminal domain-containing protein [Monaibacterium marinum]SOH94395.1 flagellar motor switch protein FliG [Monaibacterium marinum]
MNKPLSAPLPTPANTGTEFSSSQKAAIVLAALGPELASPLMRDLDEAQLRCFAVSISALRRVPQAVILNVISEFMVAMGDGADISGGTDAARRMLEAVLDTQQVNRIMGDVDGSMNRSLWDQMGQAPSAVVARFLQNEHPQTAAVVLSELRSDRAASVLEHLETTFAQNVVLRLSRVPRLETKVVSLVEAVIQRDFLSVALDGSDTRSPADLIAGLMNNVSGTVRTDMLGHLENRDPELSTEVQRVMFTFGDIVKRVEPRDVGGIVRNMDETTLLVALKSGSAFSEESVQFMLSNISKRLAERFTEEINQMPDVKLKDGEKAQSELIGEIRALAQRGELTLIMPEV